MKLIRALVLIALVLFPCRAPADAPLSYNLRPFAYDIYYAGDTSKIPGSVRWLHICDSFGDQPSLGRFHVGIRDVIKPYRWSGWYHPSASSSVYTGASPNVPGFTVSPVHAAPAGLRYNHFTFATTQTGGAGNDGNNYSIGLLCNGLGGAAADTKNGPVADPDAMYTICPVVNSREMGWKTYPQQFRELVFTANVANSTICFEWAMDYKTWNRFQSRAQPTSTASKYGNWGVDGDTVTARLIYVQNPEAPSSLIWRTTRNGSTNNSTAFNPRGTLAMTYVDANFTAASTSSVGNYLRPRILTDAAGTDESAGGATGGNTILPLIGVRYFRPNTPGLEYVAWSQPGWNTSQFLDYSTYDAMDPQATGEWLAALGWPTDISIQMGQNQTNTQQTELNAGTTTTFESDYQNVVNLINSRYDVAGRQRPKWLFIASWRLQSDFIVATGRNETNYTTMATAVYNRAVANGASFFNFQSIQHTPEDFDDQAGATAQILWSSDGVHQAASGAGSEYYVGALWNGMVQAVEYTQSLRGRDR